MIWRIFMNILKQIYCRLYQFILHLAYPLIITGKNIFKRELCNELIASIDNEQIKYSLFSIFSIKS